MINKSNYDRMLDNTLANGQTDKVNRYSLSEIMKKKRVAVWGWWQGKNLGDMWILECIKCRFPGIIPITTEEEEYSEYDFLIIGGGGLLNGPKLRAPFNAPLGTKYGAFGIGGEFEIKDKLELRKLINLSIFFGVRDTRNLKTYEIEDNRRMELSGDCTFLYPLKRRTISMKYNIRNIILIWRDPYGLMKWDRSKHHAEDGEELNGLFARHLGEVPMSDNMKCMRLYKSRLARHGRVNYESYRVTNFKFADIYRRFNDINLVVSMRYHGVVAAIQLGIPCIGLDIYPKVRTILTECRLEKYCIKLSEYDKIDKLIEDIKKNRMMILNKMRAYTSKQTKIAKMFANKMSTKMTYLLK